MSSYSSLAPWYDALTTDVDYSAFANYYESLFRSDGCEFSLLLDLGCGTGTLCCMMAARGYEMIGADASGDMLSVAYQKAAEEGVNPLFLCQEASALDLYGTVDAAYSSLDCLNYIPPESLPEVFRRLHLFIRPGGLLIFDIRSPEWLRSMDGSTYVDEQDEVLCLWRADFDEKNSLITYGMDIFSQKGRLWERSREEHTEYAHECAFLSGLLSSAGFEDIRIESSGPQGELGRLFFICRRNGGS